MTKEEFIKKLRVNIQLLRMHSDKSIQQVLDFIDEDIKKFKGDDDKSISE